MTKDERAELFEDIAPSAATAVDLFEHRIREAIRTEFAKKTKGVTYRWMVPDGPPPVPAPRAAK